MRNSNSTVTAICHDRRRAILGEIRRSSDTGCELLCTAGDAGPGFARRSTLILNLLEESTGKSANVIARLEAIAREGDTWIYRFAWDEAPDL